jgi:hypothetical protein
MNILELGLDADTIVDIDESPLTATYDFSAIVSSIYTPGYTRTVYVFAADASVMLSTAVLIEL